MSIVIYKREIGVGKVTEQFDGLAVVVARAACSGVLCVPRR